eukprot:m51a1_g4115 hypothetical protein (300) ;mRNA; r:141996-143267
MSHITRSLLSLEALAHGDAFGETLRSSVLNAEDYARVVRRRELPEPPWYWTDDTAMATGILEALLRHGTLVGHQQDLAAIFGRNERLGVRSYTMKMVEVLKEMDGQKGENWRELSSAMFGGTGSYGNGSAMRVPPLALAAAYVAQGGRSASELLHYVLQNTPVSEVRSNCGKVSSVPFVVEELSRAVEVLGDGNKTSCQDTVPFCLWCCCVFLSIPKMPFADLMWLTATPYGDVDTNCAIVGGIVASALDTAGLSGEWYEMREPLMIPTWDPLAPELWPLGVPKTGKGLHPVCPFTQYL